MNDELNIMFKQSRITVIYYVTIVAIPLLIYLSTGQNITILLTAQAIAYIGYLIIINDKFKQLYKEISVITVNNDREYELIVEKKNLLKIRRIMYMVVNPILYFILQYIYFMKF